MSDARAVFTYTADGISAAAIVATFMGYLPAFAALAAIIWYAVQIYESKTIQRWVRLRRLRDRVKRRALRGAVVTQGVAAAATQAAVDEVAVATLASAAAKAQTLLADATTLAAQSPASDDKPPA